MKFLTLTFVLLAAFAVVALAEPEPSKASRYRAAQMIEDDVKDAENHDQLEKDEVVEDDTSKKGDASSGRLFMKKFVLFKNMFGKNQKQPIIPIIITGVNPTGTTGTTPISTTITTEPTTPTTTPTTATPTTSPTPPAPAPAPPTTTPDAPPQNRIQLYGRGSANDNVNKAEDATIVDEETLAAALAAGAEEYVVTDQEIKGTSDAKANNGPARINLRANRGPNRGQVVSVRVPARYRGYFKNGQRVVVNNKNNKRKNRPGKRRVIRRRNNRRRPNRNKNKNKRRRIVSA